ncbi:MAG: tyrosine-type recombinase/integrase [Clostridia bacterium]|nr:tyrosine-type recombinase/integrase [Clostridia bacterium]
MKTLADAAKKLCVRCNAELPDGAVYCHLCGAKQNKKTSVKRRGNGQGTVFRRGKTWTAEVVIGYSPDTNRPIRRTKGGFETKKAALDYIPKLKVLVPVQDRITFAELYKRWEPQYEQRVGESTMNGHRAAFAYFKDIWYAPFVDLYTEPLQECIDLCPRGKRTKENMKALCMALYKYAGANRITQDNYAQYLYCGNDAERKRPPLTGEELAAVENAIGKIPYADYTYILCYTGLRPNEMFQMTKDAYDPVNQCLVGGFKTEAGTDRIITLSPKIQQMVADLAEKADPYIFPREDGRMMRDDYFRRSCFSPLMKRLGIEGRVPYSCRHTFSNLLKDVQGSDTDKAALMGHSDASMTKAYQSPDYASLRSITDAI